MDSETPQPYYSPAPQPFFARDPVQLDIGFGSPRKQSRVTVAFRALLSLPHVVVLFVLSLPLFPLLIVGWFAALILGRLPQWIARYHMALIGYSTRVNAYQHMVVNEFPPFSLKLSGDYPLRIEISASRLSRLKVLFRWLLVIPAAIAAYFAEVGLFLFSPIIWIVTLVLGRMPSSLFNATAAVVRYQARLSAYATLVTDRYPRQLFGDASYDFAPEGSGRELRVEKAKGFVVLFLVLGVVGMPTISYVLIHREEARLADAAKQLEAASFRFGFAKGSCPRGPTQFRCFERAELTWSVAWDKYGTELSTFTFVPSQQATAAAAVRDAHAVARALRASSRAKTNAAHNVAFKKVKAEVRHAIILTAP